MTQEQRQIKFSAIQVSALSSATSRHVLWEMIFDAMTIKEIIFVGS